MNIFTCVNARLSILVDDTVEPAAANFRQASGPSARLPARNLPLGPSHACCFSSHVGTARTPDYIGRVTSTKIRKHEAVPDTGSFEVYFDDGRLGIFV
ncbi:hypothetical protein [Bradyrhizobium sp. RDM4]|uniref:hypothetical protein n=1 Tax=Bradyrhizobium sp. RDM4 TaxID=3378765 RepID=UPI0038FBF73A